MPTSKRLQRGPVLTTQQKAGAELRARLAAYAEEQDLELIFFDPPVIFDQAIVGLIYGQQQEPAVLYDEAGVLAALVRDGMKPDEAREYFDFNTAGAFLGDATPRFLVRLAPDPE